jgi:hypothetical protein
VAPVIPQGNSNTLGKALSSLGLAYSIVITLRIWALVAQQQPIWVLPGVYFLEVMFLPALAAFSALRAGDRRTMIACMAAGALVSFSVLGAWTVGLAYAPLALLLLLASFFSWRTTREPLRAVIAVILASAAIQALAMLILASVI